MSHKPTGQLKADGLKLQVPQASYEQTIRRLEKIQGHLKRARGDRLKGKVAIITGVGSLKGIGSVANRHVGLQTYPQSPQQESHCTSLCS